MRIAGREIGIDAPPFIIAEIGINHGGSLEVAKKMVELIARSGAHCVKHQTHIIEDEMTEEARKVFPPNADVSIWEVMEQNSLSLNEERELKRYSEALGLIYISTPFSRKAADFLDEIGVEAFKIGSGEADNLPLIDHIASFGKPIIMSTGMNTVESIMESVRILEKKGVEYALLECTNLYPSPPSIVSLKGVTELQDRFPNAVVGFSDHSIGPFVALSSVALGSSIIERHFTDDFYREGPDISCSMDPSELRLIVDKSAEIWQAARSPKRRSPQEDSVYEFARSSVVADKNLMAGQVISESDIWARRPGTGEIAAYDFYKVIGKTLNCKVKFNTPLEWSMFK